MSLSNITPWLVLVLFSPWVLHRPCLPRTILLPAGRSAKTASTHMGESNGLGVQSGGNESCYGFSQDYPAEFLFGANAVPDMQGAIEE